MDAHNVLTLPIVLIPIKPLQPQLQTKEPHVLSVSISMEMEHVAHATCTAINAHLGQTARNVLWAQLCGLITSAINPVLAQHSQTPQHSNARPAQQSAKHAQV